MVRTATKFPKSKKVGAWRNAIQLKVVRFPTQYNLGMADRIACSYVTCPKCGTWVVVRQSEAGLGNEKLHASCPAPDCGKEFEFELSETRVFEIPLQLFERAISSVQKCAKAPGATAVPEDCPSCCECDPQRPRFVLY